MRKSCENCGHSASVEYVTGEEYNATGFDGDGWYYWDEWGCLVGPFGDKTEATRVAAYHYPEGKS